MSKVEKGLREIRDIADALVEKLDELEAIIKAQRAADQERKRGAVPKSGFERSGS